MRAIESPRQKAKRAFNTLKILVIGFALGAVITSLYLDNRLGAIVKAFNNPTVINSSTFQQEVVKK